MSGNVCIFAASFRPEPLGVRAGGRTYRKDVVTAFHLRHLELRNFGTYYRKNAMFFVHGLIYNQYVNMRGLRHCLFCGRGNAKA